MIDSIIQFLQWVLWLHLRLIEIVDYVVRFHLRVIEMGGSFVDWIKAFPLYVQLGALIAVAAQEYYVRRQKAAQDQVTLSKCREKYKKAVMEKRLDAYDSHLRYYPTCRIEMSDGHVYYSGGTFATFDAIVWRIFLLRCIAEKDLLPDLYLYIKRLICDQKDLELVDRFIHERVQWLHCHREKATKYLY